MPAQPIRVHCNPWHALDHLGRPAGHVAHERLPVHVGTHQGYVGATLLASEPEKLPLGHAGTPAQETRWHFSRDVVEVQPTDYYRACLRGGEILPADEAAARFGGVKFVPVAEALQRSKATAFAKWRAAFGDDPSDVDPFARPVLEGAATKADRAAAEAAKAARPTTNAPAKEVA